MSAAACATVKVAFETRVFGRIISEKGDVPIKDVAITWTILNKETLVETSIVGSTTTNEKGDFTLHIKSNLWTQATALVRVTYEKKSGQHFHTFRCGTDACTEQNLLLEHMTFSNEIKVHDTSTLPFTGRVTFANVEPLATSSIEASTMTWPTYNSQDSCPLDRVEVCAHDHAGGGKVACVLTNAQGYYTLALRGGLQVEITLQKGSHSTNFVRVAGPENVRIEFDQSSWSITPDSDPVEIYHIENVDDLESPWSGIDFQDQTTRLITIENFATLCKRDMGTLLYALEYEQCYVHSITVPSKLVACLCGDPFCVCFS